MAGATPNTDSCCVHRYVAAEKGFLLVAKMLLEKSTAASVFRKTKYGTTPMFIAEKTGHHAMQKLLLEFCLPGHRDVTRVRPGSAGGVVEAKEGESGEAAADTEAGAMSPGKGGGKNKRRQREIDAMLAMRCPRSVSPSFVCFCAHTLHLRAGRVKVPYAAVLVRFGWLGHHVVCWRGARCGARS